MSGAKIMSLRARAATHHEAVDGPDTREGLGDLALRAGRQSGALSELMEQLHRHPQLRLLSTRLGSALGSHGADDLMQCTLERVIRGIASFRADGDLVGWVGRIMRNTQIELLRKESSEQVKHAGYRTERSGDRQADPADLLDDHELQEKVALAWHRTADDVEVRLFWQRTFVGLSVEQLVRQTGYPRSTLYVMLKRGAAKLMAEVQRQIA
jgi:RNA polymerase sigma factor (sigma-70 family)